MNHLIFVWYHADEGEPTWEPKPIPEIESGKYWLVGKFDYIINAPIQVKDRFFFNIGEA